MRYKPKLQTMEQSEKALKNTQKNAQNLFNTLLRQQYTPNNLLV
jgi:hypothetical protein